MRITRAVTAVLALSLIVPTVTHAQNGRGFRDSWFWGAKAGGLGYAKAGTGSLGQAPMGGLEMLITRTHGALYTSFSQAFLKEQTLLSTSDDLTNAAFRVVDLQNVRKFDMALMAFPGDNLVFRPYVGAGFTFQTIGKATPRGPFDTTEELTSADLAVQDAKAAISPLLVLGGQYRFTQLSAFGQVTVSPTDKAWILYNGRPMNFSYEIGIRYNIGSAIEK